DPSLAARLVNTLTAEFIEQNLKARWEINHRTSEWLGGQLDDQRTKLRQSEDALQAYARQKELMYTGEKQSVSEEKLRQLQMELSKAQADRVEKQSRSEIARSANLETVPEVLNDNNLRSMEATLTDLQRQEADLGVTFKPDYTKAKQIRAEIQALQAAVAAKRKTIADRIDNELQESERREQLLAAAYARQTHVVTNDSEKSIQYDMLKHEVDTNRQIYQAMLQRVKESTIASAMKVTNVRIVDAAKPPVRPYKPNLPLNTGAGLFAGLMLSIMGVVIRSKTDGNVREPGEAGMLLGIPELGVIPAAERTSRSKTHVMPLLAGGKHAGESNLRLLASGNESPAVLDSFRAVLASILFAGAKQQQRVLVVTSASPSEGKTTTVTNLGMTLAKMNRKVLLIDGDIRSPQLHKMFGLDNTTGLTDVLKRMVVNETAVDSFIRETGLPNVHVLTSGPGMEAGADLLFSAGMPGLIARVRNQFDMVLIDTPPMLMMPDARLIGRFADSVVLIARARKTSREAVQAAYRRFVEDQTPVLGVVLNDWNSDTSPYSYYSGYKAAEPGPTGAAVKPVGA
ncbi:MAG: GumC family protein, partial [Bryobacteraceae bacterium]